MLSGITYNEDWTDRKTILCTQFLNFPLHNDNFGLKVVLQNLLVSQNQHGKNLKNPLCSKIFRIILDTEH